MKRHLQLIHCFLGIAITLPLVAQEWTGGAVSSGNNSSRNTYRNFQIGSNGNYHGRLILSNPQGSWEDYINFASGGGNRNMVFWKDATFRAHTYFRGGVTFRQNILGNGLISSDAGFISGGDVLIFGGKSISRASNAGSLSFDGFNAYNFDNNIYLSENLSVTKNISVSGRTTFSGEAEVNSELNFGSRTGQFINLYEGGNGHNYGIGIQSNTQYFRSNNSFAWFVGGTPDGVEGNEIDPGSGGQTHMVLYRGKLGVGLNHTRPTNTLDVSGSTKLRGILDVENYLTNNKDATAELYIKDEEGIVIESDDNPHSGSGILVKGITNFTNTVSFAYAIDNNATNDTPLLIKDNLRINGANYSNTTGPSSTAEVNFWGHGFIKSRGGGGLRLEIPRASDGWGLEVIGNTYLDKVVVSQTIETKNIDVKPNQISWPDYVFNTNWEVRPLAEVKDFIDKNSHLPEIPSAKEIQENGYDLAEMDAKMLQKIEELTIYVIELEEKLAELQESKK